LNLTGSGCLKDLHRHASPKKTGHDCAGVSHDSHACLALPLVRLGFPR
jgi:hypothetical protein